MRSPIRLAAILVAAALVAPSPPAGAGPTLDKVRAAGSIVLGYRDDAPPFSFRDRDGQVRGYSVELCERAALEVGKAAGVPPLRIESNELEA